MPCPAAFVTKLTVISLMIFKNILAPCEGSKGEVREDLCTCEQSMSFLLSKYGLEVKFTDQPDERGIKKRKIILFVFSLFG